MRKSKVVTAAGRRSKVNLWHAAESLERRCLLSAPMALNDHYTVLENLPLDQTGQTELSFNGSDFVYDGTNTWTTSNGAFVGYGSTSGNAVGITADSRLWSLNFDAIAGQALQPGTYANVQRDPFQDSTHAGMDISGDGRGLNTETGSFTVLQVNMDADGTLKNFAATFAQQQDYPAGRELDGHIYYHYMPAGYQSGVLNNDTGAANATLSAILVSAPQHGALSFSNDGSFVYSPASNYTGPDTFSYQASDGQTLSNVATVTLNVQPDVANPGGPYKVNEGGTAFMDGSFSSTYTGLTRFAWDFHYDGNPADFVTDATGEYATFDATTLDGPSTVTVGYEVTDAAGIVSLPATTTVTIANVAPTGTAFSGSNVVLGQTTSVGITNPYDPSTVDTAAGFKYSYDFNDDGTFDTVNSAANSAVVPLKNLSTIGLHSVIVRISDKDGGYSDYVETIQVLAPTTGSISGEVFADYNGDGIQQSTEAGQVGITVYLDLNGDSSLDGNDPSTITTANGAFSFANLAPGQYTAREILPTGVVAYYSSTPAAAVSTVTAGAVATVLFGVTQYAAITGSVFSDVTGAGFFVQNSALPGVTVYLDKNGNGSLDPGENSTTSDTAGHFALNNLKPGSFQLREVLPPGDIITQPQSTYDPGYYPVNLFSGYLSPVETFGDFKLGTANGLIFSDNNGNGVQDAGEVGLSGWTIFEDMAGTQIPNASDPATVSGSNGQYTLTGLLPGKKGFVAMAPAGSTLTATSISAQVLSGSHFVFNYPVKPLSVRLTGTVIGTSGSYRNSGNTAAKAFDGNLATYFDGPAASGNWVGLDLGSAKIITSLAYTSRSGWASRMNGGIFQASNSSTFASGVVNLYTIASNANPSSTSFTTQTISNPTAYRYVRYLGTANTYGDVAEVQFFGKAPVTVTLTKLTGTTIGTSGSYGTSGNTIAKATDGNLATFFDGPTTNGNWVGLDLGSAKTIKQISYAPRSGYASRMIGGIFQVSNTANFSSGVVNLYTITAAPTQNVLSNVTISVTTGYRYVRYLSPNGSYGDIAEFAVFG